MLIDSLPGSILRQVFAYLPQHELEELALVCRAWVAACREIFWSRLTLECDECISETNLPLLLQTDSSIPRRLGKLLIVNHEVDDRDIAEWRKTLLTIMNHFDCIDMVTVGSLDLTTWTLEERQALLKPKLSISSLIIQHLKADSLNEILPFILEASSVKFLGPGNLEVPTQNTGEILLPSLPKDCLNRLRHLALFGTNTTLWETLLPYITKHTNLENLMTLVLNGSNNRIVPDVLQKSRSTLCSLAILPEDNVHYELGEMSLQNLSFDLSTYPRKEYILKSMVQTVCRTSTIGHLFINCGTGMIKKEMHPSDGEPIWTELDEYLSTKARLKSITCIMELDSCMSSFMYMPGALGGILDKWKRDLLQAMQSFLPLCSDKGLLQVKQVPPGWTSSPFADAYVP